MFVCPSTACTCSSTLDACTFTQRCKWALPKSLFAWDETKTPFPQWLCNVSLSLQKEMGEIKPSTKKWLVYTFLFLLDAPPFPPPLILSHHILIQQWQNQRFSCVCSQGLTKLGRKRRCCQIQPKKRQNKNAHLPPLPSLRWGHGRWRRGSFEEEAGSGGNSGCNDLVGLGVHTAQGRQGN